MEYGIGVWYITRDIARCPCDNTAFLFYYVLRCSFNWMSSQYGGKLLSWKRAPLATL